MIKLNFTQYYVIFFVSGILVWKLVYLSFQFLNYLCDAWSYGDGNVHFFYHCVKSVCIWSYSGPHFPAFGQNREIRSMSPLSVRMWKMQCRITLNPDAFHAVCVRPEVPFLGKFEQKFQSCFVFEFEIRYLN